MKTHCLSIQYHCLSIASRGSLGESPYFPLCLKHKVWMALTSGKSYDYHTPATALLFIPQWISHWYLQLSHGNHSGISQDICNCLMAIIQVWPKSNPLWLYIRNDKWIHRIRSDRVPEELWAEVHSIVQEAVIKTILKKKKCKKTKWLLRETLQIVEKRREAKGKEKRKDIWM